MLEPRLTQPELEALVDRMDEDTDTERDEDLGVFCDIAWPTLTAQNG